jgi:hypothetical protein
MEVAVGLVIVAALSIFAAFNVLLPNNRDEDDKLLYPDEVDENATEKE